MAAERGRVSLPREEPLSLFIQYRVSSLKAYTIHISLSKRTNTIDKVACVYVDKVVYVCVTVRIKQKSSEDNMEEEGGRQGSRVQQ